MTDPQPNQHAQAIKPGVVLTTVSRPEEAQQIAKTLLSEQLAACVNLYPIQSVYRWQGDIQQDNEIQLIIKTDLHRFNSIQARILELHSYDLPELIALPIAHGSDAYLTWMAHQLSPLSQADGTAASATNM